MLDVASIATRPVFWGFTTWLRVAWYVLAVLSTIVFLFGCVRPLLRWRRGQGGPWPPYPWREVTRRLIGGVGLAASQASVRRRNRVVGAAHTAIFYGWIILFAGTVVLSLDTDFTKPVLGWDYFHGEFYLGYKEFLNLFGTALVAGLLVMMVRRGFVRPRRLNYARPDRRTDEPQFDRRIYRLGDWAFVAILLVIAVTGFALEGIRIAMDRPGYGGTQFVGWALAEAFTGIPRSTLSGLRHGLWWFHGLLAISFVASIPYTKAAHMLSSYMSLTLRDPLAGKRLPAIPEDRAALPAGYATLTDFSPLHLLQLDSCTRCGRCHEVCPANATGRPLSPRDVILNLHEQSIASHSPTVPGVLGTLLAHSAPIDAEVVGEYAVRPETVWSCMQCNACVEVCPVGIEQGPIINQLRRRLLEDGELHPNLQSTLQVIQKAGNSFGESRRKRGRWTSELEFQIKDARKEPVDVLWYVGDYASFDPRSQRVTQALARLLNHAGVDFGILYDGERNAGNDVRRIGEEGLFEQLAEHNIATLQQCDFSRIITTDPHTLNTLRNEYPDYGGTWRVGHHTELLVELIESEHLDVRDRLRYRVTYHDPCHLGRFNAEYERPRDLLKLLGCTLVEMPRNRSNSFCCGAGGGQIWIPDEPGQERPSENRIREAAGLADVELFVVACPKDVTMYEDAIKSSGHSDAMALREVTELVQEALHAASGGQPTVGGPTDLVC
jgi:Fe-S oxidoreductase/nitrate reductase gamma subunit